MRGAGTPHREYRGRVCAPRGCSCGVIARTFGPPPWRRCSSSDRLRPRLQARRQWPSSRTAPRYIGLLLIVVSTGFLSRLSQHSLRPGQLYASTQVAPDRTGRRPPDDRGRDRASVRDCGGPLAARDAGMRSRRPERMVRTAICRFGTLSQAVLAGGTSWQSARA